MLAMCDVGVVSPPGPSAAATFEGSRLSILLGSTISGSRCCWSYPYLMLVRWQRSSEASTTHAGEGNSPSEAQHCLLQGIHSCLGGSHSRSTRLSSIWRSVVVQARSHESCQRPRFSRVAARAGAPAGTRSAGGTCRFRFG
jgi:hypothetical protein